MFTLQLKINLFVRENSLAQNNEANNCSKIEIIPLNLLKTESMHSLGGGVQPPPPSKNRP